MIAVPPTTTAAIAFNSRPMPALLGTMEKRGVRILTKKIVEAIEKVDHGLCVELSDHDDILVDKVMFATGRRPNDGRTPGWRPSFPRSAGHPAG